MGETEYGLYSLEVTLINSNSEELSKYGLYLHDGLYLEVVFNTGLTVMIKIIYLLQDIAGLMLFSFIYK